MYFILSPRSGWDDNFQSQLYLIHVKSYFLSDEYIFLLQTKKT